MKGIKEKNFSFTIVAGMLLFVILIVLVNLFAVNMFNKYLFFIIINLVLGAAALFFILFVYEKKKNNSIKTELLKLKAEKELIYRHYQPLEEKISAINKFCHDARNILNLLWSCSSEIKDTESLAIDFVNRGETLCRNKFCENRLVNTVLCQKTEEAYKNNIKTEFSVTVPNELNINDIDICSCIFNLLDNAIQANAAGDSGLEKYIFLEINIVTNYLIIEQKNTYYNRISKGFKTNKGNKNHGLGLEIINDIAKKYNGFIELKTDSNVFYSTVYLENKCC